jgi:hypothetical protein
MGETPTLSPVVAMIGRGMTINEHTNGVGKECGGKEGRKLQCERDNGTEYIRCEGNGGRKEKGTDDKTDDR